jgi:hypothetical protein
MKMKYRDSGVKAGRSVMKSARASIQILKEIYDI